jgi:hypothetical protein
MWLIYYFYFKKWRKKSLQITKFSLFKKNFEKKIAKLRNFAIKENKQGLCHTVAMPFTLKGILRQNKELWKLKYSTIQKYNLQKIF